MIYEALRGWTRRQEGRKEEGRKEGVRVPAGQTLRPYKTGGRSDVSRRAAVPFPLIPLQDLVLRKHRTFLLRKLGASASVKRVYVRELYESWRRPHWTINNN